MLSQPRPLSRKAHNGTVPACPHYCRSSGQDEEREIMRSILLWLIGIPLPIILLLAVCTHHF